MTAVKMEAALSSETLLSNDHVTWHKNTENQEFCVNWLITVLII